MDPDPGPVLRQQAHFLLKERCAPCGRVEKGLEGRGAVVGMDVLGPRFVETARHLDGLAAEHRLAVGAGGDRAGAHVEVPDARLARLHREAELLLAPAQGLVGSPPLDRVTHGAREQRAVQVVLRQVVLRPAAHGPDGQFLVFEPRENDQRHPGRAIVDALEGGEAVAVRQREVKEDRIDWGVAGEQRQAVLEGFRPLELEARPGRRQQGAHQARIAGVVLDEKDARPVRAHIFAAGRAAPSPDCRFALHVIMRTRRWAASRRSARTTRPP